MKPQTKSRCLKIALWISGAACVLGGLYFTKCWQVRAKSLTLGGTTAESYDRAYAFWLQPAFSGELHWHRARHDDRVGELDCYHGWRWMILEWNDVERWHDLSPAQKEAYRISCPFSLESSVYGEFEWTRWR